MRRVYEVRVFLDLGSFDNCCGISNKADYMNYQFKKTWRACREAGYTKEVDIYESPEKDYRSITITFYDYLNTKTIKSVLFTFTIHKFY